MHFASNTRGRAFTVRLRTRAAMVFGKFSFSRFVFSSAIYERVKQCLNSNPHKKGFETPTDSGFEIKECLGLIIY